MKKAEEIYLRACRQLKQSPEVRLHFVNVLSVIHIYVCVCVCGNSLGLDADGYFLL